MSLVLPPRTNPNETDADRRIWPRYRLRMEGGHVFLAATSGTPHSGRLRDLSRGGAALVATQPHKAGSVLTVDICYTVRPFARTLVARVAWVVEITGGYLLGATFLTPLGDEDLRNLVAVLPAGAV